MKKLSRKIVWLLLIVFVFTVGSGFSVRRSAALPGAGEQLSGFRVEKIERLDTPGGKTAYLTHEATGAAAVYIEDTGAAPALTLAARTTDGLRRVTLTADSAAELLRGAKESLGAGFGGEYARGRLRRCGRGGGYPLVAGRGVLRCRCRGSARTRCGLLPHRKAGEGNGIACRGGSRGRIFRHRLPARGRMDARPARRARRGAGAHRVAAR